MEVGIPPLGELKEPCLAFGRSAAAGEGADGGVASCRVPRSHFSNDYARFWLRQLGALLLCCGTATGVAAERSWTVVSGDTLTSIARSHGVTIADLRRWNGLDTDHLGLGQSVLVDGPRDEVVEPTHTVLEGETLSEIASDLGLSMGALIEYNPGLDPDLIYAGQVLRIGAEGRRVRYEVQSGENLTMIAARYETTVQEILAENAGLTADYVRAGDFLTVVTRVPHSNSKSLGSPNDGELVAGVRLPRHRGYVIRDGERAWGTVETVFSIRRAFDAVLRAHPGAPLIEVHDLSLREGGPLEDHRSHQSGRDADLAYFYKRCNENICGFERVRPSQLDVPRQWTLLHHWLSTGVAESIFVDYALQAVLYREAKRLGATREELSLWFQYPRGRSSSLVVIRHYPAHADHLHVRFACHDTDEECRTFRPLLMQLQQAHVSAHSH